MIQVQGYTAFMQNISYPYEQKRHKYLVVLNIDFELFIQDFEDTEEAHIEKITFYKRFWKNVKREEFLPPIMTPWGRRRRTS